MTVDTERLAENETRYTAICDLKGRIHFGLWLKRIMQKVLTLLSLKIKLKNSRSTLKIWCFFKMTLSEQGAVFPKVVNGHTEFSSIETDISEWQKQAIMTGQAWIAQATEHEFQPQELRLHQREGVNYDKGCYLGQEIVARLWFKAKPKHWLHLVQGTGDAPAPATQLHNDVEVVNSTQTTDGYIALVVAKPAALQELGLQVLDLPEALSGDVARPQ